MHVYLDFLIMNLDYIQLWLFRFIYLSLLLHLLSFSFSALLDPIRPDLQLILGSRPTKNCLRSRLIWSPRFLGQKRFVG